MQATRRFRTCLALGLVVCCSCARGVSETREAAQPPPGPDAVVLADFRNRIDAYMVMHKQVETGAGKQKETSDVGRIEDARLILADRIRAARKDARPGDIFTPQIRALFRRLLNPGMQGADGRESKAAMKEDAPTGVSLTVNAPYPAGAALPTVPPKVLNSLPQPPADLEYRFVGRHLILMDVDANLIVDFVPNAIAK